MKVVILSERSSALTIGSAHGVLTILRSTNGKKKPETFDFLGFTHYCGVLRDGKFRVKRKTMRKRLVVKPRR